MIRYSGIKNREPESDILELVDQFGGMLIDRPERVGFQPDEALVLLEHRNLKGLYNRYLEVFAKFVEGMEKIEIQGAVNTKIFARLQKIMRDTKNVPEFVEELVKDYSVQVNEKIDKLLKTSEEEKNKDKTSEERALFSPEMKEKILKRAENIEGE